MRALTHSAGKGFISGPVLEPRDASSRLLRPVRYCGGGNVREKENAMSVAKVVELTAASPKSFEDAVRIGIERAEKTLDKVEGAWIAEQKVKVEKGRISEYRVTMRVTFVLKG